MPIIVLLQNGGILPSNTFSYARSFLEAYQLAETALGSLPEKLRLPRPSIICAPEKTIRRTARVISDTIHSHLEECAALLESAETIELIGLTQRCLISTNPLIIVASGRTISRFIKATIDASQRPYLDRRTGLTRLYDPLAIDTDARTIVPIIFAWPKSP